MPARTFGLATTRRRSPVAFWRGVIARLALRRQRSALARLDDRLLDDIGVDQDAARAEAARPVWDAPPHWYR